MEVIQLRFRAVCDTCKSKLPPRSEAWQDPSTGRTICDTCKRIEDAEAASLAASEAAARDQVAPAVPAPDLNRAPRLVPVDRRRAEGDEVADDLASVGQSGDPAGTGNPDGIDLRLGSSTATPSPAEPVEGAQKGPLAASPPRGRLPKVGPSLAARVDVARTVTADAKPAGNVFSALEAAREHGLSILESRPWSGTQVDSEAIVVAPSGVWIVDAIGAGDTPVDRGFLSGVSGSELLNTVGGRTSLISGLLFDSPFQWVSVRGALCFDAAVPSWFEETFTLAGIAITTPRSLTDALFAPLRLDAATREAVAAHLLRRF